MWLTPALAVYCCTVVAQANGVTQQDVDLMAQSLSVKYDVIENFNANYNFTLTLENTGSQSIGGSNWEIYFCNLRLLYPDAGYVGSPKVSVGYGLSVSHIDGCLHKLAPTSGSVVFAKGQRVSLVLIAQYWMVAKTDVTPNWFVVSPGLQPKVIASTAEGKDIVGPFDTPAKWKRTSDDRFNPITPAERYGYYKRTTRPTREPRPVPMPKQFSINPRDNSGSKVKMDAPIVVLNTPSQLQSYFPLTQKFVQSTLQASSNPGGTDCSWRVCVRFDSDSTIVSGGYRVAMLNCTLVVKAKDDSGALSAAKTLYQLRIAKARFDNLTVADSPRFSYRGIMIDIVRNYHNKDVVKRLIDIFSLYKFNHFHLLLGNDEGWRLEIDGLPELTQVGGRTCYDPTETVCVLPQLGALPNGEAKYLSKADYKEVLRYAADRGIKLLPEFDMPGHSRAAIKSMEARYRTLVAAGNRTAAEEYLLSDLDDKSAYITAQFFTSDVMNPCLNSTYRFVEKIVKTVQRYHQEAGYPLSLIHLGGDEVPTGVWINSTVCRRWLAAAPADPTGLDAHGILKKNFIKKAYTITSRAGIDLALWEDGLLYGASGVDVAYKLEDLSSDLPPGVARTLYGFAWQFVWDWGASRRAYVMANAGYKVVIAPATHFYFDHAQEPDPTERGYYWATRFSGSNKTFGFMPDDVYGNANHDLYRFGQPLSKELLCQESSACPPLNSSAASNIIGVQGNVFTETGRTEANVQTLAFPRALALAERAWHKAPWESIVPNTSPAYFASRSADWESFSASVGQYQLPLLASRGVVYHLNPPGVVELNGRWLAVSEFYGQGIEYSTDGGQHWITYDERYPPRSLPGSTLFSTITPGSPKRRSRAVSVTSIKQSPARPAAGRRR